MIETTFTPGASLLGGALIGLAAVALMALSGRIFGATGILAGIVFDPRGADWRLVLLAGMVTAPGLLLLVTGQMPAVEVPVSLPMLLVGGVLVGLGVSYGSGCTSGHGVCGLARLSPRSLVATLTFMATTAATVFLVRHVLGA